MSQWPAAGCDALAVHLIIGAVACSLAIGVSWKAVVGTLGIMIPWQLAHWEEYHSGRALSLAKALSGQLGASSQEHPSKGSQLQNESCCLILKAWSCSFVLCLLHPQHVLRMLSLPLGPMLENNCVLCRGRAFLSNVKASRLINSLAVLLCRWQEANCHGGFHSGQLR